MPNVKFRLAALSLLFLLFFVGNLPRGSASQDSLGGASLIFIAHPKNPPVRPRASRAKAQQTNQPVPAPAPAADKKSSDATVELSDAVEDALELGNSARDAEPPRYQDAEKAYRLAAKLDDDDPRPYLGLANLWYDQKNYQAAAKMYREATDRMTPKNHLIKGALVSKIHGSANGIINANRTSLSESAEAHAYLGNALLQAGLFPEAEAELRTATSEDSKNAPAHALLGYSFFQQKKYAEATEALKKALELSPNTEAYKQLLEESVSRQQH
jgi:tetratricopeptide (TPR) repeat protein